jgi:hypothetical protein
MESSSTQISSVQIGMAQIGSIQVGSLQVRITQIRSTQRELFQISKTQIHHAKCCMCSMYVMEAPKIPSLYTLLKYRQVFLLHFLSVSPKANREKSWLASNHIKLECELDVKSKEKRLK